MHSVYILYSHGLDKHYIGCTENIEIRVNQHLDKFYSNSFTSIADDWKLVFKIDCVNKAQALAIEKHIKRMKSKTYLQNLMTYPEMTKKLLAKYNAVGSSR